MDKEYDIFISYKSENVNIVRPVVEYLISNGLKIWFAEYQILFRQFEDFQSLVYQGIDNANYYLIFTNDLWAESKYCQREIERILKLKDCSKIIEICIPKEKKAHQFFPILNQVPSLDFKGNIQEILKFIVKNTTYYINLQSKMLDLPKQQTKAIPAERRFGVSLNYGKFTPSNLQIGLFQGKFSDGAAVFSANFDGIDVTLVITYMPIRTMLADFVISDEISFDDRLLYRYYRAQAEEFIHEAGANPKGLHILFKNNVPHLSYTYTNTPTMNEFLFADENKKLTLWTRNYFFPLSNFLNDSEEEIHLSFMCEIPTNNESEEFKKFCKVSSYFDKIADSLKFQSPNKIWNVRIFALLSGEIFALFWIFLLVSKIDISIPFLRNLSYFLYFSALAQFVFTFTLPKFYNAKLKIPCPSDKRAYLQNPVISFMLDFPSRMILALVNLIIFIFTGIMNLKIISLICLGLIIKITNMWYWVSLAVIIVYIGTQNVVTIKTKQFVSLKYGKRKLPGFPDFNSNKSLYLISSHLETLLVGLRSAEFTIYTSNITGILLFFSIGTVLTIKEQVFLGIVFIGLAAIMTLTNLLRILTYPPSKKLHNVFKEKPTPEQAMIITNAVVETAELTGKMWLWIRAFIWSAELFRLQPDEIKNLQHMSNICSKIIPLLRKTQHPNLKKLHLWSLSVGRDILLELKRRITDKNEIEGIEQHLVSVSQEIKEIQQKKGDAIYSRFFGYEIT